MLYQVYNCLANLGFDVSQQLENICKFVAKITQNQVVNATALHVRAEELLRSVYLLGVLPSSVRSEARIDNMFSADHLI